MSYRKFNLDLFNNYINRDKYNTYRTQINSPHNPKINNILDISPSQSITNNNERTLFDNNHNYNYKKMLTTTNTREKTNEIAFLLNKKNYQNTKSENNKNNTHFSLNNIKKINPKISKDIISMTEPSINMRNRSNNYLNNNGNTSNSALSNNNNSTINDNNNIIFNTQTIINKFSSKKQT